MSFRERVFAKKVGTDSLYIGAEMIHFAIVDASLEPKLPNFVGRLEDNYYFLSEEIPTEYRKPILTHEVNCFALKACGRHNHCIVATEEELRHVSQEIRQDYLALRRTFFRNLARMYESQPTSSFYLQICSTRDYLVGVQ